MVERSGKLKQDFAADLEISPARLRFWFSQEKPNPRPNSVVKLARLLKLSVDEVRENLGMEPTESAEFDHNVEPYSMERLIAEVPMFDLPIAAGGWADVSGQILISDPRQIEQGLFRVYVRGDSMQPVFMDGQIVEFRICRIGRDSWPIRKHCYIQLANGDATFKTIYEVTEEKVVLHAINKRKYPRPLTADVAEVVSVGVAMGIYHPVN